MVCGVHDRGTKQLLWCTCGSYICSYITVLVAVGSMGYKHTTLNSDEIKKMLQKPSYVLKVVPHVDCTPRICELVEYKLLDINMHGAWGSPAALDIVCLKRVVWYLEECDVVL